MIFLKTQEEIELLRESNRLVGKTLGEVSKHIRPGISTLELDKIAEDFIRSNGGVPGFLGYGGFPNTLCISVNDEVVHGIPSSRCLEEGDVVSVDCGVVMKGGKNEKSKEKLLVSRRNSAVVGILFSGRCSGFESYESSFSFESRNRRSCIIGLCY